MPDAAHAGEPVVEPPPVDAKLILGLVEEYAMACTFAPRDEDEANTRHSWRNRITEAIHEKITALWASGVAEGRRQRDAEIEELQVPEPKVAQLREWLRMHGNYDVKINLWAAFGTIWISVTNGTHVVWSNHGTTWEKRLDLALAYLYSIDPPEGQIHG